MARSAPAAPAAALCAAALAALVAAACAADACEKRKVKSIDVTSCNKNGANVLDIVNATSYFTKKDDKCMLEMKGCVYLNKAVKTTHVKMTLKKRVMTVFNWDGDLCEISETMPVIQNLIGYCTRDEGLVCTPADAAPMDISQFAHMLDMARGKWTARIDMHHDTGDTCLKLAVLID